MVVFEGFGKRSSWNDDVNVPAGHRMTFKDSLHIASTDIFLKLFIPSWILRHGTTKMRNIEVAFEELDVSNVYAFFNADNIYKQVDSFT